MLNEGQSHASADIEPRTNECLPLSDQTEPTPEAKSPEALEDENRPDEPSTEHQANLEAASEHTQPLYLEYYERAYGKDYVEEEDIAYTYWKWDKQKQQWHHRNEDTKSEAWFRA
ncbi:hypothetical protein F4825DRAFT_417537 [Nemania diffusa]|nr:hypothetical protein F4825DRAFT_417537 [Nemania diffusa]